MPNARTPERARKSLGSHRDRTKQKLVTGAERSAIHAAEICSQISRSASEGQWQINPARDREPRATAGIWPIDHELLASSDCHSVAGRNLLSTDPRFERAATPREHTRIIEPDPKHPEGDFN
jgi:hypothetical protein